MTHDEIIKQLESLLSHCKSMIEKDGGFPIWEKDCEALEAAIAALRPSGEPLTLEQLKEMDGQPVWLHALKPSLFERVEGQWALVESSSEYMIAFVRASAISGRLGKRCSDYGRTWQAYAYPPIDREKWEPCEFCEEHENPEEVSMLTTDEYESDRGMFIYNGILASNSGEFQMRRIDYCPVCGRPLTEAAWTELEKRVRG